MFTSWSSQLATTNSGKDRRTLLPSIFIALPHISNHLLTVTKSKYSGWLLVLIGAMHWVRPTFVAMLSKWGFQWASHPEAISCEDKKFRARESKRVFVFCWEFGNYFFGRKVGWNLRTKNYRDVASIVGMRILFVGQIFWVVHIARVIAVSACGAKISPDSWVLSKPLPPLDTDINQARCQKLPNTPAMWIPLVLTFRIWKMLGWACGGFCRGFEIWRSFSIALNSFKTWSLY